MRIIAGHEERSVEARRITAGASRYLRKSRDELALLEAIDAAIMDAREPGSDIR